MDIVVKKISDLKPYKNNAKKHPKDQIEKIAESIKEFGFTQPILIDKNNTVIAGHGRCYGAKKAGLKEVPCIYINDLTEDQVKAYRLVDNKLNESEWDFVMFEEELNNIIMDMDVFGVFSLNEEKNIEEKVKYTRKINAPIYEIKGECPDISELCDRSKSKELLEEIKKSNLSEEQKTFLKLSAYRHLVFNYGKIAEYYVHQNSEMQDLMEKSALVILDYNRAYELGYVNMMQDFVSMCEGDEENEL